MEYCPKVLGVVYPGGTGRNRNIRVIFCPKQEFSCSPMGQEGAIPLSILPSSPLSWKSPLTMSDDVSCVRLNDRIGKNYVHIAHTWRAWHRCVSGDVGLIRPIEQIATRSPPKSTDMVSRLQNEKNNFFFKN